MSIVSRQEPPGTPTQNHPFSRKSDFSAKIYGFLELKNLSEFTLVFVSPLKRRSLPSSFPTTTELVNTAEGKIVKAAIKNAHFINYV